MASGTDALLLPLRALDPAAGEEVVTTPFTFFATAGAIHNAGLRPVFADILPDSFGLDPEAAAAAVTDRTRALLPVHLFGRMADMAACRALADARGLFLLEDAAQAIGAEQRIDGAWRGVGTVGDAATLSFFPTKNLGGFGDGGMVVTDDQALADRVARLRVHGGRKMYHHEEVGTNSRLDALQAAVLLAKLPRLARWTERRRENAARYHEALAPLEARGRLVRPPRSADDRHVFNQYTVRLPEGRDRVRERLAGAGVGTGVYYPVPLHLQPCFAYLGHREGEFPESERAAREVLSLPIFPELSEPEIDRVVDALAQALG